MDYESAVIVDKLKAQKDTNHEKSEEKAVPDQHDRLNVQTTWWMDAVPNANESHATDFNIDKADCDYLLKVASITVWSKVQPFSIYL